ncbi:hypothetical protein SARC_12095, partial [Sphaeroforma arctica JP610]
LDYLRGVAVAVNKRKNAQKLAEELDDLIVGSPASLRSPGRTLVGQYMTQEVQMTMARGT